MLHYLSPDGLRRQPAACTQHSSTLLACTGGVLRYLAGMYRASWSVDDLIKKSLTADGDVIAITVTDPAWLRIASRLTELKRKMI